MNKNRDLSLAVGWAVLLLLLVLLINDTLLRILVATPLLFFMTGHVLLRAIGWVRAPLEHVAYAIGTSITLCVIGGFVLNTVSLLTPFGWTCWLLTVVSVGAWFARRRPYEGPAFVWSWPTLNRGHLATIGLSVLLVIGAYLIAVHDEATTREFKYTSFWMLPMKAPGKVLVGIENQEATPQSYDVRVTLKGELIAQLSGIEVAPGDTWTQEINVGLTYNKAEALLYRSEDHAIYRKVSTIIPKAKADNPKPDSDKG